MVASSPEPPGTAPSHPYRLPFGAPMSMLGVLRGPRQVLFGAGQRHVLGTVTAALGSRALVCTDARFGSTREFADLVQLLEGAGVRVTTFTEVLPDVPVDQVKQCAELAARVNPDVVVG